MKYISRIESPVGPLTALSDGENLTALWAEKHKYGSLDAEEVEDDSLPVFQETRRWLECYFQGKDPGFMPPLAPEGSPFCQSVLRLLSEIPYGQLTTYGEIARKLEAENGGKKRVSAQAVGGAVGHNPVFILIPCHRVVGTGGSLTGYAGGLEMKVRLLKLEKAPMEHLFMPKKGTAL